MRKYRFLIVIVVAIMMNTVVYATDTNKNIKVGLTSKFDKKEVVQINEGNLYVGYDLDTLGIYNGVSLNSGTNFTVAKESGYFLGVNGAYNTYQEANTARIELALTGHESMIGYVDTGYFVVLIGTYENTLIANAVANTLGISPNIYHLNNAVSLYEGTSKRVIFLNQTKNPQVMTSDNTISIGNNNTYRGILEVHRNENSITMVNIVNMEQYLYSVTASEMPSSWPIEGLKAQAVAARTYAFSKGGVHDALGYVLCDTTHCQVYNGINGEAESSIRAVNETNGIVAYYNNKPIDAVFSSSSGGYTANSEDVWVGEIGYLRGKADTYDTTGKVWTRTFSNAELTALCNAHGLRVGNVTSVTIDSTDSFGRVTSLTLYGDNGMHTVKKDAIRSFFSKTTDGSLSSTLFTMKKVEQGTNNNTSNGTVYILSGVTTTTSNSNDLFAIDKSGEVNKIEEVNILTSAGIVTIKNEQPTTTVSSVTFDGKGWGHGVGLSQHGARGMATAGFKYDEILKFYYDGIELK